MIDVYNAKYKELFVIHVDSFKELNKTLDYEFKGDVFCEECDSFVNCPHYHFCGPTPKQIGNPTC